MNKLKKKVSSMHYTSRVTFEKLQIMCTCAYMNIAYAHTKIPTYEHITKAGVLDTLLGKAHAHFACC